MRIGSYKIGIGFKKVVKLAMGDKKKFYDTIDFLLLATIFILLNVISTQYFFRIDLTEEKRYTIADASKNILQSLDDIVYVEIYLDGDLPPGFKRLQRSIRETLDEFRIYAGANVQYKFIDPTDEDNLQLKNKMMTQLAQKGVQPTNLFATEKGKQTEKLVFPGAIISYKGMEQSVVFLKGASGVSPAEVLNQSVEGVEFELISTFRKLAKPISKRVGIVQGHGEADGVVLDELYQYLKESYAYDRIKLADFQELSSNFDILIIVQPTKYFSEADKLKIDQFVVKGGRILLFIDKAEIKTDRLGTDQSLAGVLDLNLDDLLFKWGIRVNNDIIQDMQSGVLPMVTGMLGDKPQTQLMPWRYYPLQTQFGKHPLVKNMGAIMGKYVSSIDTVKAQNIAKIPLVFTSKYRRIISLPAQIELESARKQPEPSEFNGNVLTTGILLEGRFKSLYLNRLSQQKQDSIQFKVQDLPSKIIVFSDGDMMKNDLAADGKQIYPMGFDRYLGKKFANKDLIVNALTYLSDDNGIINIRLKEVKLRPLDRTKIKEERQKWQMINVVVPVLVIVLVGIFKFNYRRRKYGTK
ncbi:MAG: gliding motility-associated ABC transporter substrate-binding protein GldG [Cytophagales bacterium]